MLDKLFWKNLCYVCQDAETPSRVKAGCGCVVALCDDCRDEQNAVQHGICKQCKVPKRDGYRPGSDAQRTIVQEESEEDKQDYEDYLSNFWGDDYEDEDYFEEDYWEYDW